MEERLINGSSDACRVGVVEDYQAIFITIMAEKDTNRGGMDAPETRDKASSSRDSSFADADRRWQTNDDAGATDSDRDDDLGV